MPQFLVAVSFTIAVFLTEPHIRANERIRTLGKDTLGESLKVFQVRYPKARCEKPPSIYPGNNDGIYCCLNDGDSLSEVSRFPILNLDGCAVRADFWKSRLCSLSYMLDVRSVQVVLDDFKKLYGSPTRESKDPKDATRLIFVDWMEGTTSLQLMLSRLGGEDFAKDTTHSKGVPWLEVVSVDLWNSNLATARN
jgi:hypothetical protein